jgi:hypothetical protein
MQFDLAVFTKKKSKHSQQYLISHTFNFFRMICSFNLNGGIQYYA